MANDIGDWFRNIPLITRYWFSLTIAFPLAGRIGILKPAWMVLNFAQIIYQFQIWRLATSLFYYPIMPQTGFHYLINLYFLYNYSVRLETGVFDGRPADYLFMLTFNWLVLLVIGYIADLMLLMEPMILSVLYVWCQLNKDQIVSFWFGTQFKAMYLPWILVGFNLILRGGGLMELLGIVVGHLYFFLMFKYPQDFGGRAILRTPDIFYHYLPNRQGGVAGFGMAPASRRANNDAGGGGGRHDWGQGNALGRDE